MSWVTVADRQVGFQHVKNQRPCDDRARVFAFGDGMMIGAVSDGAGSACRSAEGAEVAVESALCSLRAREWTTLPVTAAEAEQVMASTVATVISDLRQYASREQCQLSDLHCTLLLVVASPRWLLASQIGDGFIVIRCRECQEYEILFPPAKGGYSNETEFITTEQALEGLRTRVISDPEFLFISTDGLESSALKMEADKFVPHPGFFRVFDRFFSSTSDQEHCSLVVRHWLESPKLNGGWAYDDKGILIAYLNSSIPSAQNQSGTEVANSTIADDVEIS